jgi:hypothetical protein
MQMQRCSVAIAVCFHRFRCPIRHLLSAVYGYQNCERGREVDDDDDAQTTEAALVQATPANEPSSQQAIVVPHHDRQNDRGHTMDWIKRTVCASILGFEDQEKHAPSVGPFLYGHVEGLCDPNEGSVG